MASLKTENKRVNTIIPVAGGKGGTGKSIITANLALALAKQGHSVVAVDLDLGGCNLYTYLGLQNDLPAIGDFLNTKNADFDNYIHPTHQSGLRFVPGDGRTPFLANMGYTDKIKLIRRLHKIEADYVLIDLGAGSTFNTLDHFSLAAHGLLVTNNDKAALMGMLVFMKNFLYRVIGRTLKEFPEGQKKWGEILAAIGNKDDYSLSMFIEEINDADSAAAEEIRNLTAFYRPRIIVNAGTHPDDVNENLNQASGAIRRMLNINAEHFGFVFADPAVSESIAAGKPLLEFAPDSLAAKSLLAISGRISSMWQDKIENSEQRLLQNTQNIFRTLWSEG